LPLGVIGERTRPGVIVRSRIYLDQKVSWVNILPMIRKEGIRIKAKLKIARELAQILEGANSEVEGWAKWPAEP
jgi:hypothetical protein